MKKQKDRKLYMMEEFANSLTHSIGFFLSILGSIALLYYASDYEDEFLLPSVTIYGISLILLYGASTIYHSVTNRRLKAIFKVIDHAAIFILIAGTYTPYLLVLLRQSWASLLIWFVWAIAIAGVVFKLFYTGKYEKASTFTYLGMGWLAIVAIEPMLECIPFEGLLWIFSGGLFYTVGTVFFHWESLPFNHAIWHVFVLGGSTCHFISVFNYVLPAP